MDVDSGGVNESDYRQLEPAREFNSTLSFPETLRPDARSLSQFTVRRVRLFLLSNHDAGRACQPAHSNDYCLIVGAESISVEFHEMDEHAIDVIGGFGAVGAARHLDHLPRLQMLNRRICLPRAPGAAQPEVGVEEVKECGQDVFDFAPVRNAVDQPEFLVVLGCVLFRSSLPVRCILDSSEGCEADVGAWLGKDDVSERNEAGVDLSC